MGHCSLDELIATAVKAHERETENVENQDGTRPEEIRGDARDGFGFSNTVNNGDAKQYGSRDWTRRSE